MLVREVRQGKVLGEAQQKGGWWFWKWLFGAQASISAADGKIFSLVLV